MAFFFCISLFPALYEWRFSVWPPISPRLAVLLAIWSLSSYVIGRYVSGDRKGSESETWDFVGKRQLIGTCTVLLEDSWNHFALYLAFDQNPFQATFLEFLIPFLGSLAV